MPWHGWRCLADTEQPDQHGIWGGLTERERRARARASVSSSSGGTGRSVWWWVFTVLGFVVGS
jgi:hypothetical protein